MEISVNRRTFLKLSLFYGVLFSSAAAFAGNPSKQKIQQPDKIDVHHHILPPVYTSALAEIGITGAGGVPFPNWDVQQSLDVMDRNKITTAITSISSPGVYFKDSQFSIELAKQCNEFSADMIQNNKMRFGGFAVLPLPDMDAALQELEYALDVLKLDGVVLLSNVDGHYQGTSKFDHLYSEFNQRKAIVYIHPTIPPMGKFPKMNMPTSIIEFVFDTTRAISNMIQNKIFTRFPEIRFIFAHAGGTAPYIAWRMSLLDYQNNTDTIRDLKTLYYDTALSASPYALQSLQELIEPSHLLFGSDYPYAPEIITARTISGLNTFKGFDEKKRTGIYRKNALALFPQFCKKQQRKWGTG